MALNIRLCLLVGADTLRESWTLVTQLRASIMVGCKLAKCCCGEEKRGERREAGYKLTASLGIEIKKLYERDK